MTTRSRIDQLPPRVKVCCIADEGEAELAIEHGAAAIGLVSWMPSGPGIIDEDTIGRIAAFVAGRVETFLLTCLSAAAAIAEQHSRCVTTTVQLVDRLQSGAIGRLRLLLPRVKLVQVVHVTDEISVAEALAIAPLVDALLLDSGNPALEIKELGGTGRTHDWSLSRAIVERSPVPVWLAGGLTPDNVAEAVARVRPYGLDVCSGLRRNGRLDSDRLSRLMGAVHSPPADR